MKILVVTNDFPPRVGGIQTYVCEIATRLDNVTVLASTSPRADEFDRAFRHPVVRVPAAMILPTPRLYAKVKAVATSMRADLVLFGAAVPLALLGPTLRRDTGIPFATFTHGLEIAMARLPGGRALLHHIGDRANLVTAVSQWTADVLRPHMARVRPLELLPSGVDITRFHPDVSDAHVRRSHDFGPGPIVGCVSRLVRRKGQDAVLRAVAMLTPERPDLQCLIVGGGPDAERLRAMASSLGIGSRAIFAGEVDEHSLPGYFRVADVFAMPCRSRWAGLEVEALGAALLQAAAVGRPIIAGRSAGAPETVIDGQTGLVVDGRDHEAVAAGIIRLIEDRPRAAAMGAAGAARIQREFSWDQIAGRCRSMLAAAIT